MLNHKYILLIAILYLIPATFTLSFSILDSILKLTSSCSFRTFPAIKTISENLWMETISGVDCYNQGYEYLRKSYSVSSTQCIYMGSALLTKLAESAERIKQSIEIMRVVRWQTLKYLTTANSLSVSNFDFYGAHLDIRVRADYVNSIMDSVITKYGQMKEEDIWGENLELYKHINDQVIVDELVQIVYLTADFINNAIVNWDDAIKKNINSLSVDPISECTYEQFKCPNGKAIPFYLHCDGENDCDDMGDEQCTFVHNSTLFKQESSP